MRVSIMARLGEVPGRETIPAMQTLIPAGWPSAAEDYIEEEINLHARLVRNPLATFMLQASGDSMTGAGILDGATLVVDRSVAPYGGAIVIAEIDGEFFVKRLEFRKGRTFLVPANPGYPERDVTGREDFRVWGVVIHCINSFGRASRGGYGTARAKGKKRKP